MGLSARKDTGSRAGDDGNSAPAPPKRFPAWTELEQEFWQDMFENFSESMINQIPEEDSDLNSGILAAGGSEEYYRAKIRLAAIMADEATVEMIYRFERQEPLTKQRKASGHGDEDKPKKKRRVIW